MEDNPFEPGAHGAGSTKTELELVGLPTVDLDAARGALAAHTSDLGRMTADRAVAGPRLRGAIRGWAAVGVVSALAVAAGFAVATTEDQLVLLAVGLVVPFIAFVIALSMYVRDRKLVDRTAPHAADDAARAFWMAAVGRPRFAWSMLAPTARAATVAAPPMGAVPTGEGTYPLTDWKEFRSWTQTFASIGHGQQRALQCTDARVVRREGDLAVTRATLKVWSLPRWAVIVAVVGFVLVRLVGLVFGLVMWFAMRRTVQVEVEQRWLLGADDAWYLVDVAMQERAS